MRKRLPMLVASIVALLVLVLGANLVVNAQGKEPPARAKQIQASINAYKADLAKQGMYNCCTKMSCDMCATHMGGCPCGKNLAAKKPVCPQCKGMWHAGGGKLAGIKAEDVKVMKPMAPKKK